MHIFIRKCKPEKGKILLKSSIGGHIKVKVKSRVIVLQATYAASLALCIIDRAGVHTRLQPKLSLTDFGLEPYSCM